MSCRHSTSGDLGRWIRLSCLPFGLASRDEVVRNRSTHVIDWKKSTLADLGRTSAALHRYVGIDLRRDWTMALRQAGFDAGKPTAWIAEGLLVGYLPPAAQDEILDALTESSTSGSRFAADYFTLQSDVVGQVLNNLQDLWSEHDPRLNLRSLTFPVPRQNPSVYLAERGWTTYNADHTDLFRAAGRAALCATEWPESIQSLRFLTATRD
jgi:methyltransferase (TIGR00027 family)